MAIQRPDWTATPPSTAVVASPERHVAEEAGRVARPDWGPKTIGPRETPGTAVARTPQPQAPRPTVARSADGRILRPNWGAPPPAAPEAEATDDGEQEAEAAADEEDDADDLDDDSAGHREDPLADLDAEDVATWRKLLADGLMSREQLGRAYALSEDELDALSGTPARRPSDGRTNVEDMDRRGIDKEIEQIQKLMREDRREYERKYAKRYGELLAARGTANERAKQTKQVETAVQAVLDAVPDAEAFEAGFESVFADLAEHAQTAIRHELALPPDSPARPASEADLERFATTEEGAQLVKEWGKDAGRRLATVRARIDRMLIGGGDMEAAVEWFDQLTSAEAKSVLTALAGGR
jgi:hypothetical protein